ncbi:MAG: hypothetical protein DLM67_26975 [Candidatus Nephthysia bennettiae]|nr:MAG: hypothetical protein DLM67_26975 [Candidatus Dormibacteraeota bacterium]
MQATIEIRRAPAAPGPLLVGAAAACWLVLCTCSFAISTAHITSAQLARGYNQGKAVNPTTTFRPSDRVIHLVVVVGNAPDDTKVGATWYAVDAGGSQNEKLDSASGTLKNGEDHIDLTLSNTANWPRGRYRVDLMLDDKRDRSIDFAVS